MQVRTMQKAVVIGLANIWLLASTVGSKPAELVTDFDSTSLEKEVWNDCQVDRPPLKFEQQKNADGSARTVVRVVVDGGTRNINDSCIDAATGLALDQADGLTDLTAPSLVTASPLEQFGAEECPTGGSAQRNELRLQQRPDLIHEQNEPHWYALTFRADGNIPSCGSAQWILSQWKQERNGDSPFLAQRFDNGVLHVTVQNNHCRCAIAKADGDYEAFMLSAEGIAPPADVALKKSKPIKCTRSDLDEVVSCEPVGMDVLTVDGAPPPSLPDPKHDWVTMAYLVRGGSDGNGQVDVYANGRFVVRVKGLIGYETSDPGPVKFKFGHYRKRLESAASISVDRLCLSEASQACAPGLQPVP